MRMKFVGFLLCVVCGLAGIATPVHAQVPPQAVVINPATSSILFQSTDHNTILGPGEASAGQPMISGYQLLVFLEPIDVTTGVPIAVGPVTPKILAALQPGTPPTYRLTLLQAGITVGTGTNQIPPCTAVMPATCQIFTALLVAVGPDNRASARVLTSESNPFLLASLVVTQPAAPGNVVVK